jgi:alpha-galactosidase
MAKSVDIWLGELSDSRQIMGIANWKNDTQDTHFNLSSLGIAAAHARDLWASKDIGDVSRTQNVTLAGHELRLWLLSNITVSSPFISTIYYDAAKAHMNGSAHDSRCSAGDCLPTGTRVGSINSGARVTFSNVTAHSTGQNLIGVDFINYDYAFGDAWEWGDNARNMTIGVNGHQMKRWAFPLSGGSWNESGRLVIEADGFNQGAGNVVTFGAFRNNSTPDLVGFEILG